MIRVYEAADLQEAHIVLGLLAQARIEASVFNQHAQGGLGDIPFGETYPSVWIADERDQRLARKIIDDYRSEPEVAGSVWCPACGEESPGNFAVCWRCGAKISA